MAYHDDVTRALIVYFSPANPDYTARFVTNTDGEVRAELKRRLEETELRSCFVILAHVEALFREDYKRRRRERWRDALSRALREITSGERASLDEEIFEHWAKEVGGAKLLIGNLRGAFKLRNWLAHGRYWTPKLGRDYAYEYVYELAKAALEMIESEAA